jgi:hypothetical protein
MECSDVLNSDVPLEPAAEVVESAEPEVPHPLFWSDGGTVLSRSLTCRFIEGDPLTLLRAGQDPFCGKTVVTPGAPYCAEHRARAFVRASETDQ